jgi:hypothetical protein
MLDVDLATPALQRLTVDHIYDLMALTFGATGDAAGVAEDAACVQRDCGRYNALPTDVRVQARVQH